MDLSWNGVKEQQIFLNTSTLYVTAQHFDFILQPYSIMRIMINFSFDELRRVWFFPPFMQLKKYMIGLFSFCKPNKTIRGISVTWCGVRIFKLSLLFSQKANTKELVDLVFRIHRSENDLNSQSECNSRWIFTHHSVLYLNFQLPFLTESWADYQTFPTHSSNIRWDVAALQAEGFESCRVEFEYQRR